MQRLNKKLIEGLFHELDRVIDSDLEQPSAKFSLITIGGTTLTLKDLKLSTKDVDFMVEDINLSKAKKYFKIVSKEMDVKIDLWNAPHVFSTTLPTDYRTKLYGKKYKHFDVHLLNLVDIAVTKIARFNDRDKEDIGAIIENGIAVMAIQKRFNIYQKSYSFANEEDAKNNMKIFNKLFQT